MMEELMLHVKILDSKLNDRLRWQVEAQLMPGLCHHIMGPNGAGKSTFLEELKLHWPTLFPGQALGFCDQLPLAPFQDLTVQSVMNLLWDVTPDRHLAGERWQDLVFWKDEAVIKLLPRLISQLSGGENQWIKILMMRSLRSDVWMMDEPFQSLDKDRQATLWKLLNDWLSQGKTLILVHHGEVKLSPIKTWHLACNSEGVRLSEVL